MSGSPTFRASSPAACTSADTRAVSGGWGGMMYHLDRRRPPVFVSAHGLPHRGFVGHIDELALVGQVEPEVDCREERTGGGDAGRRGALRRPRLRSEEHTSELQSP